MSFFEAAAIEGVKAALTVAVLGLSWIIGQRIISYWELKRKAKEMDIASATQFQQLFGEYKEIWRLWKVLADGLLPQPPPAPDHTRWHLLSRASAAEGRVEAVFVKLASQRLLPDADISTLGLFRQAYQLLRQGIRDNHPLNYGFRDAEYELFNKLGCQVAHIIAAGTSGVLPSGAKAWDNFQRIIKVRTEEWLKEVAELKAKQTAATSS